MKLIPTILVPEPTIPFAQYDADVSARDAEIERLRARTKRLEEALSELIVDGHVIPCFQRKFKYPDNDFCTPFCKKARAALED